MDSSTIDRTSPNYYSMHLRSDSTATTTTAGTNSVTGFGSAITLASTHSTSPTIAASHMSSKLDYNQQPTPKMTVYYRYNDDGKLQSTSTDETLAPGNHGHPDLSYYVERGDQVGAFLAQREMRYPAFVPSKVYGHEAWNEEPACEPPRDTSSGSTEGGFRQQFVQENDSYHFHFQGGRNPDYESTIGYMGFAAHSGQPIPYPDPEDIRHLHTLHSILPYIQPERKLNSLDGQTMDIVEQDTGTIFAWHVPKKLLVLFLGRRMVTRYIRTTEREDNEDFNSKPVTQVLSIPRNVGSKAAFRVLVAWMIRACQYHSMGQMRQFRVPQNTLAACTLAQTLALLGLHKDALRVDFTVSKEHFERPIFPVELEAMWNCLGEKNRYVCAAINIIGQRLRVYEIGSTRQHQMWEEMLQLLDEYPPLKDRVRDLELNEKYRPIIGTEWCRNLIGAPQSNGKRNVHQVGSSRARSRGRTLGSNAAPEQETASVEVEASKKQVRKAAVLRIVA